jgi:curli biogenesis system outer membrane secretion channel CsgG
MAGIFVLLFAFLIGTFTIFLPHASGEETKTVERRIPVVKCSEAVGSLAVIEFDCKAKACQSTQISDPKLAVWYEAMSGSGGIQGVGKGLTAMFITALKETNCFRIVDLEQYEKMKKLMEATGQTVKPPKVDITVMGSITVLELEKSGGALGGGFIPILGAIHAKTDKATVGVEMSVVKPETLEVILSRSFEANSERTSWGLFGGGWGGSGAGGGGWSISKNMSLDAVARDVVVQMANSLAEKLAPDKIVERPKLEKQKGGSEQ